MIKNIVKSLIFTAAAAFLFSCEKAAVGDATVGFAGETFEVNAQRYVMVPITVTGTTSVYPIVVDVELGEVRKGVEDETFMITDTQIRIPKGKNEAYVEVLIPRLTEDVEFDLQIKSIENAQKKGIDKVSVKVIPAEFDIQDLYGSFSGKAQLYLGQDQEVPVNLVISKNPENESTSVLLSGLLIDPQTGGALNFQIPATVSSDFTKLTVTSGAKLAENAYDPNMDAGNGTLVGGDGHFYFVVFNSKDMNTPLPSGSTVEIKLKNKGRQIEFNKEDGFGISFGNGKFVYTASHGYTF